jgi:hypothetical protein
VGKGYAEIIQSGGCRDNKRAVRWLEAKAWPILVELLIKLEYEVFHGGVLKKKNDVSEE